MTGLSEATVAQIATRLLSQLPGAPSMPRPPTSPADIKPDLGLLPAGLDGVTHPPAPSLGKRGGEESTPFSSQEKGAGGDELSHHSERLTQDQVWGEQNFRQGDLTTFVKKIQYDQHAWDGGLITGGRQVQDPFAFLRGSSASHSAPGWGHSGKFDVNEIRRDFPILQERIHGKQLIWFDNAATTQKPQAVIDALSSFYTHDNSNIHRGAHTLAARSTDGFETSRETIRAFLKAPSVNDIIFVRGTTEGINLVANSYGRKFFRPGDEIVLTTLEHHANIVPWQIVAQQTGAVIKAVPINDRGEINLEAYQRILNPRTRFVALAHANNSLGTILPVKEMTELAKRYGATVLIDGAQSVAHIPVNVQELNADFYVFSGHKIFGPTGIGAVYGRRELLEAMPPWQGGGNMIKNVTFEETTYSEVPAKFEAGTPNVADAVGLTAALNYVNRLGLENIAKYEHELLEYATDRISGIDGYRIIGTAKEKVGVISLIPRNRRVEDVGRALDQQGIAVRAGHHCAQPSLRHFGQEATVRPSISLYNTRDEIDYLVDVLRAIASESVSYNV